MGFADWKKRSEAFANVMTYSVPTRSNILRALQAAYKAGERDGRKQVEALAYNGARLAVMVEREACAKTCEALELVFECKSAQPGYWPDQIAHKCAIAIRERSNVELTGSGQVHRPESE